MGNFTSGLVGATIGFVAGGPVGMTIGLLSGGVVGFGAEVGVGIATANSTWQGKHHIDSEIISSLLHWNVGSTVEILGFEITSFSMLYTPLQMFFAPASTLTNGGPCNPVHHYAVFRILNEFCEPKWIVAEIIPDVQDRKAGIHVMLFDSKEQIRIYYPNSALVKSHNISKLSKTTVSELVDHFKSFNPNYNLHNRNCQHFCIGLIEKLKNL